MAGLRTNIMRLRRADIGSGVKITIADFVIGKIPPCGNRRYGLVAKLYISLRRKTVSAFQCARYTILINRASFVPSQCWQDSLDQRQCRCIYYTRRC